VDQLRTSLSQTESRLESIELELEVERRKAKTYESHISYLKDRVVALETQLDKSAEVNKAENL
jgi:chromosome segregation ATPase